MKNLKLFPFSSPYVPFFGIIFEKKYILLELLGFGGREEEPAVMSLSNLQNCQTCERNLR